MARRQHYKPIARIRRVLLLALVLAVGGIVGYYVTGGFDTGGGPVDRPEPLDDAFTANQDVVTVARGFDYEVTEGGELAYRVRADELISDIQDRMDLKRMEVELPQDDGGSVVVVADRGTIHLDSKSANLEGNVRAVGDDGIELEGQGFEVVRDGRQLISKSPVTFGRPGEYTGSARELHYGLKKERLLLEGDVVVDTVPADAPDAGSIRCQKLVYDRREGTLRLDGNVRVSRGSEFLEADRLSLTLGPAGERIRFVRAEGSVRGRFLPETSTADPDARVDFKGKILYAAFEPRTGHAETAELRGGRSDRHARLELIDTSGLSRLLRAPVIVAEFRRGEIAAVDAQEPVLLVERHAFAQAQLMRRVCADQARVEFDRLGEMRTLELEGGVDYQAPDVQIQGDRLTRGGGGKTSVVGRPALILNERGDLRAPEITHAESGLITARDGVRAEFTRDGGFSLLGGASEEPVRVTSERARWEREVDELTFSGRVRAWQGRDYLLADTLTGEPGSDRLTAEKNVKTVLKRESSAGPSAGEGAPERTEPIEITAKKLIYEQATRVITYTGDARAVQAARVLQCDEMDVELDENDEFERLVCEGDLRVDDPGQSKRVRGDKAIYLPGTDQVDVTGDPVVLTDLEDGTELRGGRVVYRFDTGAAQVSSRPERAAPASGESG